MDRTETGAPSAGLLAPSAWAHLPHPTVEAVARGPQPLPPPCVRAAVEVLAPAVVLTPVGHEWLRDGTVDDQPVA
eukprot:4769632-Alexandrium_andersonii.AAC.1